MPAGINVRSADSSILSLSAEYDTFLDAELTARETRDTAIGLLSPSAPIIGAEAIWSTYMTSVRSAFDTLQSTIFRNFNKHSVVFETGFQYVTEYIHNGIGPLISDLITLLDQHDAGFDNHFRNSPAREEINAFSDEQALMMTASIKDEGGYSGDPGPGLKFHCDKVSLSLAGSSAVASKQTEGKETEVFTFGGTGFTESLRGGERVQIKIDGGFGNPTVMVGSITSPMDDLLNDGAGIHISDDLFKLEGVTPIGCLTWDPIQNTVVYAQADDLVFNKFGLPNKMETRYGPLFAPYPGYGWELKSSNGGVSVGGSSDSADFWTIADVFRYMRFACYGTLCSAFVTNFPYNTLYEGHIIWPQGLHSIIAGDLVPGGTSDKQAASGIKDSSREQGTNAKVVNLNYGSYREGYKNLKYILQDLCRSAGAYAPYCAPTESGKSVLTIVRTRNTAKIAGSGSINTTRVVGTKQGANRLKLHSGILQRNYRNMYSSVTVIGDPYAVETRAVYDPVNAANSTFGLEPAWTQSEENLWRDYINQNISTQGPQLSFFNANMLFPRVFCAYRIKSDLDYLAGGLKTGFPRVNRYPKIFAHLLTWIQEYKPNGQESLKRREYLPIRFEITASKKASAGVHNWIAVTENDGLEIDIQGNIYLPGLREAAYFDRDAGTFTGGQPSASLADSSSYNPDSPSGATKNIQARGIRATFGIMGDFCLTSGIAMGVEEMSNGQTSVITDVNSERNLMSPYFRRNYVACVGDSYRLWQRGITGSDANGDPAGDSYPIPQTVYETATTPDEAQKQVKGILGPTGNSKITLINEQNYADLHAIRRGADVMRPERSCRLQYQGFIIWQPGTHMMYLNTVGRNAKARIDCVIHTCSLDLERNFSDIDGI